MTSLQAPLTVLPCAGWTDEDVWFPKASKSIGPMTGFGMSFTGSLLKMRANPLRSQGILNLNVGGVLRHESVTIDLRFLTLASSREDVF